MTPSRSLKASVKTKNHKKRKTLRRYGNIASYIFLKGDKITMTRIRLTLAKFCIHVALNYLAIATRLFPYNIEARMDNKETEVLIDGERTD